MGSVARKLVGMAIAAAMIVAGTPANAAPVRRIAVRICYGDTPTPMQLQAFEQAKQEAAAIYAAIGISLEWSTEENPPADPGMMHLTVHVLSDGRTARFMKTNPELSKFVLGAAPQNTGRVYVFWERIAGHVVRYNLRYARVVGRVLAHEIGHHLLPGKGHSADGLMRPSLNYGLPNLPRFTAAQEDEIRTFLAASNG